MPQLVSVCAVLPFVFLAGLGEAFPKVDFLHDLKGMSGAWHVCAGDYATCATVNGSIECFGVNTYKNALPSKIGPWTHMDMGPFHSCGIQFSGLTECWGMPWEGENMMGAPKEQLCNVEVAFKHACAVTTKGTVVCWGGKNVFKQSPPEWLPFKDRLFVQVSTSHEHTCAVFNDGAVQCIGNNQYGQAPLDPQAEADGKEDTMIKFPELGTGYMQVSTGAFHSCAVLSNGGMECWGRNDFKQAPLDRFFPNRKFARFLQVSCGLYHCCAIRSDGAAECWGKKTARCSTHYHGTPECEPYYYPGEGKMYVSISSGNYHSCAIDDGGSMQCWGSNRQKEGPRKVESWKVEDTELPDGMYSPGTVPGSCQGLVLTRKDFYTRVNGATLASVSPPTIMFSGVLWFWTTWQI